MVIEKLSERVAWLRKGNKWLQRELSEFSGVSVDMIEKIEAGKRGTSIENLIKLSRCFDVPTDYLLGLTDNPHKTDISVDDPDLAVAI